MRRTAVHFWPALMVISLATSLTKRSNSAVPGFASGPRTVALSESASRLNGTPSSLNRPVDFRRNPVAYEPVNVTTSWRCTGSRIPWPLPTTSCRAPSGRIPLETMSRTTRSVKKLVNSDGLTTAGTPASRFTAIFSSMPHTGKLNALMCTATPRSGSITCWPPKVPPLESLTSPPSMWYGRSGNSRRSEA